jgi:hypothetical protein
VIEVIISFDDPAEVAADEACRHVLYAETPELAVADAADWLRQEMLDDDGPNGRPLTAGDTAWRVPERLWELWEGATDALERGELRDAVVEGLAREPNGNIVLGVPVFDDDGRETDRREQVWLTFSDAGALASMN